MTMKQLLPLLLLFVVMVLIAGCTRLPSKTEAWCAGKPRSTGNRKRFASACAAIFSLFAVGLAAPALAAAVVLSSPGQLGELSLKAGESITVSLPNAKGCIELGVYEKSGSIATAGIELAGGGYKRAGVVRLVHLYGPFATATLTARADTGSFHVTYKVEKQSTCFKQASSQAKT
jgi:hypothetical protein